MSVIEKFGIGRADSGIEVEIANIQIGTPIEPQAASSNTFFVMLVNMSDRVVRMVQVNDGEWRPTQSIGRTCEYCCGQNEYERCHNEEKWRELVAVSCGSEYRINVAWQEDGKWRKFKDPWVIFAGCGASGGSIGMA